MDKADKKSIFRKKALKRLRKPEINNYKIDKILLNRVLAEIKTLNAKDIMLFIPLKSEPNINPLIKQLRQRGYNLYVPFMEGLTFKLVKYRLPLNKKRFGIKEPNNSYIRVDKIDLAIVPIIGIDKTYRRVGFGKGMYDRFYEKNSKYIKNTLFIQRELFYINEIITNSYDISANKIISNSVEKIYI